MRQFGKKCGTVRQAKDDNIVRRMGFAHGKIRAIIETQSEYLILFAVLRQQLLRGRG